MSFISRMIQKTAIFWKKTNTAWRSDVEGIREEASLSLLMLSAKQRISKEVILVLHHNFLIVKGQKVVQHPRTMHTLTGAIHEKYDDTGEDGDANDSFIQVYVPKSGPHVRSNDSGRPGLPQRLTLDGLQISTAGDNRDITELCGHVTELDLTKNFITDWKEVFHILEHIPHLHFLNLTLNPLHNDTLNPLHNDTLNPLHNDTLNPLHNDTLNPLHNDTLNPLHNDTLNPLHNDTLNPLHNDTLNPLHNDTLNPLHNDTLNPLHNDTLNPLHNDILNPLHNDTLNPLHNDTLNPLHNDTLNPLHNDTLNPLHNDTLNPLHNDTLNPLHNDTLNPLHNDTLNPLHNDTLNPLHNDTLNPLHNDTLNPLHNDTLNPLHNDTLNPLHNDTLNPLHNDTLNPLHNDTLNPLHNDTWDDGIQKQFPNLTLNPLHNDTWDDGIQKQFPNLTLNPLHNDTWDDRIQKQFPNLRDIVLNSTEVSWPVVAKLLSCFPNLTELHVSLNKYKTVDLPEEFVHKSLTKLFVNNSEINDWSEISELGVAFPCLQTLNIIDNRICVLSPDSKFEEFPSLTDLNISKCQVSSWEEVDKFRHFPVLMNLRIMDLPLVKDWEAKQRRQHLVARMPSIKQLNGSKITETEREEAERAFLRYFMDSQDRPARYIELEETHGKLDPLADVKFERVDYINLLVKFEDKEEFMDIYLHQNAVELKKFLRNFTGIPAAKMQLYYVEMFEGEMKQFVEIKSPSRRLLNYNMNSGDEIRVYRKDC